jgi:GNAT superfamily N-acetyltransferase
MRRERADGYCLDDDPALLDLDAIVAFMTSEAYWGTWRTSQDIATQIERSFLNLGVYAPDGPQIGFGRVISDGVAFAYLADVYVLDAHRGRGLGKALVEFAIDHGPDWRWALHTRDAQTLYAQYGFGSVPDTAMERPRPGG